MKLSRKFWFYIIFFAVLLGVFYAFALRQHDFSEPPLAVINPAVPAFSFTNQDGKTISQRSTDDKVYVVNYFFTTCRAMCPMINANMRVVFDEFKNEPQFMIISHTCMPETDSVPLLKAYEERMVNGKLLRHADGSYEIGKDAETNNPDPNWNFVTGKKAELYRMARVGYLVDNGKPDSAQNISQQFIHTQFFALVDKYRRVRGIYDGLKEDEVEKLIADIHALLKEKVDHTRFMNGFSNTPE